MTHKTDAYPDLLTEIPQLAPILFVSGNVNILSQLQIAIVGSRKPTPFGREIAHEFAAQLAQKGFIITSGFARGIDAAAHQGALKSGRTIAVFACGLDQIYPPEHRSLSETIQRTGGALVSEFPIGVLPKPSYFPRRNRLISGLTVGTLVIEAAEKSGSLITARYAMEQNREVFAVPGPIHSPVSRGTNQLIRSGAKLVESIDDIIEELTHQLPGVVVSLDKESQNTQENTKEATIRVSSCAQALLEYVGYEVTPIDLIIARAGKSVEFVSSHLLELEVNGYIVSVAGGFARQLRPEISPDKVG